MRNRFHEVAGRLLDEDPEIALILADIGYSRFHQNGAAARHPHRVINVGIREQLMIGVAAGFALEGFCPIVHSYTPFLVERPFEQIKLNFAHQGVTGILVSTGASYDAAAEGRTHQAPEDVALISTLPHWSVMIPGHPAEVEAMLRWAVAHRDRSVYIRLSDEANRESRGFIPGRFAVIRQGSPDAALVIAVGPMLDRSLAATAGLDATVLYASSVRPFDTKAVARYATSGTVVIVEPYLEGTSSDQIATSLTHMPHRQLAIGVPPAEHRHYGSASDHDRAHGLDAAALSQRISRFVAAAP